MIVALLVIFGLTMAISAEGMNGKGKHENRAGIYKLIQQLDLDVEQKKAFKVLKQKRKASIQIDKEERKAMREAMREGMKPDMEIFMSSNTFDKVAFKKEMRKKFNATKELRNARRAKMVEKRASTMEKIFNILSPKQREKLIELSKK